MVKKVINLLRRLDLILQNGLGEDWLSVSPHRLIIIAFRGIRANHAGIEIEAISVRTQGSRGYGKKAELMSTRFPFCESTVL